MLRSFAVENFLSFKSKQIFEMIANKDKFFPDNLIALDFNSNEKLVKSAVIYGANASGKSNLVKALRYGKSLVLNSVSGDKDAVAGASPYKLDSEKAIQASELEYEIFIDQKLYKYGFIADKIAVHEEWLYEFPKNRPKKIFHRSGKARNANVFNHEIKIPQGYKELVKLVPDGSLLLGYMNRDKLESMGAQSALTDISKVYDWFKHDLVFWNERNSSSTVELCHRDSSFKEMLMKILGSFDLNIVDVITEESEDSPKIQSAVKTFLTDMFEGEKKVQYLLRDQPFKNAIRHFFVHQMENSSELVHFHPLEESRGTNRLFDLLGPLLLAISNNATFVVDELETSIHPQILHELIKFVHKQKSSAQLIFTTHYPGLLSSELMRRDQVWFTEKKENDTQLFSLKHFSDISRKDDIKKYERWYLNGRFGAIPFIDERQMNG